MRSLARRWSLARGWMAGLLAGGALGLGWLGPDPAGFSPLGATVVAAQDPGEPEGEDTRPCAAYHLPTGHWAARQAARFDRAGLLERDHATGFRSPEVGDVVRAFDAAGASLEMGGAFQQRLAVEMRGLRSPCQDRDREAFQVEWLEVRAGGEGLRQGLGMGEGSHRQYDGPVERPEAAHPASEVQAAVTVMPRVAVAARARAEGSHLRAHELYGTARLGSVDVWAGRRAPGYGSGVGGSLVLSGGVPLDGGGLRLNRGPTLPWIFEYLGPVRFETEVARMNDQGSVERPWFWAYRLSLAPTDWLRIAANRGTFLGGEGSPSITLGRLGWILLGSRPNTVEEGYRPGDASSQVAAAEVEVRGSVRRVPVAGYLEWGFSDNSGMWMRQPGILTGVELPALGASASSLGVEVVDFHTANSILEHGVWYRHHHFQGGWADRGRPLGHPLGGTGREILVHGTRGFAGEAVRADLGLFHRDRHETNAFAPPMEGTSHGFRLRADGGGHRFGASVDLEVEHGGADDRTRAEWAATVRWFF